VVDAVRCAVEVQTGMVDRNKRVPQERRIEFRIGVHLGDVVEEDDGDLMGDGINIAARLEAIAAPGAICLSDDAYRQVKARIALPVSDLGETRLKNIAEPIRAYSLRVRGETEGKSPSGRDRDSLDRPAGRLTPPDQSFDRSVGVPEYERRRRAGVFFRRDQRRHHHRSVETVRTARDRSQLVLCL
jgi:adenylate cyclase